LGGNPVKKALASAVFLGLTTIGLGVLPLPAKASIPALTNLFVFGDSLSDGGKAGLLSNGAFPPWPYVGGRASNGEVAVEYLWKQFNPGNTSFKPYNDSTRLGTNFALLGSTTGKTNNRNLEFPNLGNRSQLQEFIGQNLPFNPSTSLFVVWFFPNDLLYWSGTGKTSGTIGYPSPSTGADPALVGVGLGGLQAVIDNAVNNIATSIEILASKGATNFLVPSSPNLGLTPFFRGSSNAGLATAASFAFNSTLTARLDSLQASLSNTDIIQFNTDELLSKVTNNKADYGLANVIDSCLVSPSPSNTSGSICSNPDEYLYWDDNHPTTAAHRILGSAFYDAVRTRVPGPLPVLGAAAAFGFSRKLRKRIKASKLPVVSAID
jgi:phospholipase/lecithinase/hemolysin